jgi:hypothetical protein
VRLERRGVRALREAEVSSDTACPSAFRALTFSWVSVAVAESRADVPRGRRRRRNPLADGQAGPLLPVREGWLLRRVEGHEAWNLVPAPYRRQALSLTILPLVLLDLLSALLGGPTGLTFVAFLVTWRGARPIAEALMRRAMAGTLRRQSLAGLARGEVVRVRGRVRPGPSFVSAGGQWAAVLAAYAGEVRRPPSRRGRRRARGLVGPLTGRRPWSELRGIDFVVDLQGGGSLVVSARDAFMLPPAEGLVDLGSCRTEDVVTAPLGRVVRKDESGTVIESVLAEWVIAPGDEVEIFGVLDFEVTTAAGSGTSARTGGLSPVLKATGEVPLVVRSV